MLAKEELTQANLALQELQEDEQGMILDNGITIYEDDYVSIEYLGCEVTEGLFAEETMVFNVHNFTDVELAFQGSTLAIDGVSLGYVSGSDAIAAKSTGKVRFSTEESFPTMQPSIISGVLTVIDFSELLLSRSYDISFVDITV
jgi:hypothetical protein